jgi:hypothetical protein
MCIVLGAFVCMCMHMNTNVWGVQLHFNWRREALSLYRDILRASRHFTWKNEHGEVWGKVIAVSTRTEYEQARDETVRSGPGGVQLGGPACLVCMHVYVDVCGCCAWVTCHGGM